MKSAAAYRRTSSRGFTLLEILVVLTIMMLIISIGAAAFTFYDDADPFEEPVAKITQMSKFALHSAALQHRSFGIAFDKTGFGMVGASGGAGAYYSVPGDMKVLIFRMGAKGWEKAEGHVWPFGEQGICEPIKLRFENKEGFRELSFQPLTGTPADT